MRRPLLALALALAAGCGKSKQGEQMEQVKALCLGFPAAQTSLNAIEQQYQQPGILTSCSTSFHPPGVQGCPFDGVTSLCRVLWGWTYSDRSLCSPIGCTAICEAWAPGPLSGQLTGDEVACATRFSTGQPP